MEVKYLLYLLITLTAVSVVTEIIQLFFFNHKNNDREVNDVNAYLSSVQEKINAILQDAIRKANQIITNAELKGIKIVAKEKIESSKIIADYHNRVAQMEKDFLTQLEKLTLNTESSYQEFIKSIQIALERHLAENKTILDQKANQFVDNSQTVLNSFLNEMHDRIKLQLDRELMKAKEAIAEYKKHRLTVIDQNIIDILERTMQIALGKKISLTKESDIIYKALEEAKKENALS